MRFIPQPLTTGASVGIFFSIAARAAAGAASRRSLHVWVGVGEVEALADDKSNTRHAGDDRLVGNVRRMHLRQLDGVGEKRLGRHRVDDFEWIRLRSIGGPGASTASGLFPASGVIV